MLIDSHCHLDGKLFSDDRDAVLEAARAAGVGGFLTIGTGDGPFSFLLPPFSTGSSPATHFTIRKLDLFTTSLGVQGV
jgi:hypothetical protein